MNKGRKEGRRCPLLTVVVKEVWGVAGGGWWWGGGVVATQSSTQTSDGVR